MKKRLTYLIIMYLILVVAGCKCKSNSELETVDEKKSNVIADNFIVAQNADLFAEITARNFINTEDILDIIGSKIGGKASETESNISFKATLDTREIQEAKIDLFNAKFDIQKSESDSVAYHVQVKKTILEGGSIYQVLTDLGMEAQHIGVYTWKLGEYIDATTIDVGDTLFVDYYLDSLKVKKFNKFAYKKDRINLHEFYILGPSDLEYKLITYPYEVVETLYSGELSKEYNCLDRAMKSKGIGSFARQQANDAMESQLALSSSAQVGDTFEIYVRDKVVNGQKEPNGKVLFVKFSGRVTGSKVAYRFVDDNDASAYNGMYTETGKGLVQANIRPPLNLMHITSAFGYRIHPILGRRILHQGMDLRGSSGTPIYAVTSGKVIKATNSGDGYGNEVRIRHDNGMVTQYAHMQSISTSHRSNVGKGQVIGTVGSTGRSTGPHLHFGVMLNGKWVNPKTNLKMVAANQLEGEKKTMYFKQIEELKNKIALEKQIALTKQKNFVELSSQNDSISVVR